MPRNRGFAELRYPFAFDVRHLSSVLRLFTDTVSDRYARRQPGSKNGAVTVIQRASSDLRLNPHFHILFLDGVYLPRPDDEVNAALGKGFGESDPPLATLLSAAVSGLAPAVPTQRRAPVRLNPPADFHPEPKGPLCTQDCAFNLHAARRIAPNDKQGREMPCRYTPRPPWPTSACTLWRTVP